MLRTSMIGIHTHNNKINHSMLARLSRWDEQTTVCDSLSGAFRSNTNVQILGSENVNGTAQTRAFSHLSQWLSHANRKWLVRARLNCKVSSLHEYVQCATNKSEYILNCSVRSLLIQDYAYLYTCVCVCIYLHSNCSWYAVHCTWSPCMNLRIYTRGLLDVISTIILFSPLHVLPACESKCIPFIRCISK